MDKKDKGSSFLRAGGSQYLDGWEDKGDRVSSFLKEGKKRIPHGKGGILGEIIVIVLLFSFFLGKHLSGELGLGLLELEELLLGEDLGELVEVLGLDFAFPHPGVGKG